MKIVNHCSVFCRWSGVEVKTSLWAFLTMLSILFWMGICSSVGEIPEISLGNPRLFSLFSICKWFPFTNCVWFILLGTSNVSRRTFVSPKSTLKTSKFVDAWRRWSNRFCFSCSIWAAVFSTSSMARKKPVPEDALAAGMGRRDLRAAVTSRTVSKGFVDKFIRALPADEGAEEVATVGLSGTYQFW